MKAENQHGYVVVGAHISLKKINERTKIEVIPGKGKVLYLKLGNETGLTNATSIEDDLKCFIPDHKGNQSSIMKKIIDVFGLELRKGTITCEEFNDLPEDEEFKVLLHLKALNKYETEYNSPVLKFVIEFCHLSKIIEDTQISSIDRGNNNYKTHFMIKSERLSIQQIVEKTDVFVFENEDKKLCFKMGTNIGITNAKCNNDNLFYVTAKEGSDVEEMMYKIAEAFKLNVIGIMMPIASSSDKVAFDDAFFNTYGNAIIKNFEEDKVILSIRSIFTGNPEPGYVSLPVDFLDLND